MKQQSSLVLHLVVFPPRVLGMLRSDTDSRWVSLVRGLPKIWRLRTQHAGMPDMCHEHTSGEVRGSTVASQR